MTCRHHCATCGHVIVTTTECIPDAAVYGFNRDAPFAALVELIDSMHHRPTLSNKRQVAHRTNGLPTGAPHDRPTTIEGDTTPRKVHT
jgi:hypothetical protein